MGIKGLEEFAKILREIPEKAKAVTAKAIAKRADALVSKSFAQGISDAGRPWRPTKAGNKANLKPAFTVTITNNTVKIDLTDRIAWVHQTGAYRPTERGAWRLPSRKAIPYKRMSSQWLKWMRDEVDAALFREFGK